MNKITIHERCKPTDKFIKGKLYLVQTKFLFTILIPKKYNTPIHLNELFYIYINL